MKLTPAILTSFTALLALLAFSFFFKFTSIPIRIWDEARLANNALQMYANGNYWVTFYEDSPDMWNTKPPLMIWLQVFCMKFLGVTERAVRLPASLASLFTGLALWGFCFGQLKRPWLGFLAGSVLACTYAYVYIHAGRSGDYDALLVLFTTLYALSLFQYAASGSNRWLYLFWCFLTTAVLIKGVAGLLLLPGLALFLLLQQKVKGLLHNKALYIGGASFLMGITGYYLLREFYNPGYLNAVYQNELGGRYFSSLEEHQHPFWYYLDNLYTWRYPYWIYFAVPSLFLGFRLREKTLRQLTLFNTLVILSYLFIISSAQTKLEWYDLPIYPFCSLQIALLLFGGFQLLQQKLSIIKQVHKDLAATLLFSAVFFLPFRNVYTYIVHFKEQPWDVEPHKQGYFIQHAIQEKKDLSNYLFCYEGYNGQIAFYIRKLQLEKTEVHLTSSMEWLQPGQHVIVSQPAMEQQLLGNYVVKKIREQFGCREYLVLSKL